MLINANYDADVKLNEETIKHLSQYKVVGLYAAIQFVERLETVIKQLEEAGLTIVSSKPDRTDAKFQILGCDVYKSNYKHEIEPDVFLYIGDGLFHPRALVLVQKDEQKYRDVVIYDPVGDEMRILDEEHGKPILRKYRGGLMKFINAENIGLFVTLKWGQQQFKIGMKLQEKYPKKKVYIFIGDTLERNNLLDFPFVQQWVNTACPRIGFDDNIDSNVTMINITDALLAEEVLSKDSILTRA